MSLFTGQDKITQAIAKAARAIMEADTGGMTTINVSRASDDPEDSGIEKTMTDEDTLDTCTCGDPDCKVCTGSVAAAEETGAEFTGADEIPQADEPAPGIATEGVIIPQGHGLDTTATKGKESDWFSKHDVKISGYAGEKQDLTSMPEDQEPTRPVGKGGPTLDIDSNVAAEDDVETIKKSVSKKATPPTSSGTGVKGSKLPDTTKGGGTGKAQAPTTSANSGSEKLPDTTGTPNPRATPPKGKGVSSGPVSLNDAARTVWKAAIK